MANDEIKFLPIFQILDIKNIWFLLELEMALATAIKKKFEPVWLGKKKPNSFVLFLEESEDTKSRFEIIWPLYILNFCTYL